MYKFVFFFFFYLSPAKKLSSSCIPFLFFFFKVTQCATNMSMLNDATKINDWEKEGELERTAVE